MQNNPLIEEMYASIDRELQKFIDVAMSDSPKSFKEIIRYQLGWTEKNDKNAQGKRIRPLLLLLVCNALGGDWRKALPAAISVEMLHNYSLIHDDIEDRSLTRRGRECIWVKWGEAQAINAGDALCALACSALSGLRKAFSESTALAAMDSLIQTNFLLTTGQFLDLAYEKAEELTLDDYWKMVRGKTGDLISLCFELGGMLAENSTSDLSRLKDLGMKVGIAFQVQDDWLGIWGNQTQIGKSNQSDLRDRKKTYPVLIAFDQLPDFRDYWIAHNPFTDQDIETLAKILDHSNIKKTTLQQSKQLYDEVFADLSDLFTDRDTLQPLKETIERLFSRSR